MERADLMEDALFVGFTRPAMRWGVTYGAIVANAVVTLQMFLLSKNLLTLLAALPVHAVCFVLCLRDPRFFDLISLWCRTTMLRWLKGRLRWGAASYGGLEVRQCALRSLGERAR